MLANDRISTIDTESDTTLESERELIWRCQKGDRHSFRLLYRIYQKRVRSTLYQLCGSAMLDDLVQEVFFRAWKGLPKLRQAEYFSTWLYRISWNVAIDCRRQLAKSRNSPAMLHYQDVVKRGLANLSLDHRAVLVLHDLEDLPQKQVAKILDIPLGTVKSRLFHARSSLRKFLQREGISL